MAARPQTADELRALSGGLGERRRHRRAPFPTAQAMLRALRQYLEDEGAELTEDAESMAELDPGETVSAEDVHRRVEEIIASAEKARATEMTTRVVYSRRAAAEIEEITASLAEHRPQMFLHKPSDAQSYSFPVPQLRCTRRFLGHTAADCWELHRLLSAARERLARFSRSGTPPAGALAVMHALRS
jgi:predicted transcriptional regulator/plasmid stabilization system protein ParE